MSRLAPLTPDTLPKNVRNTLAAAESMMGFMANDALAMARSPLLLERFAGLVEALYQPDGAAPLRVKRLVGLMASSAAGCQYCVAHTSHSALGAGLSADEINALWSYETAECFSEAERAAIRVAHHGALVPNAVTDAIYAEFARYFDEAAQVELVGILSLFGFLNRWNATLATEVEALPAASMDDLERTHRETD